MASLRTTTIDYPPKPRTESHRLLVSDRTELASRVFLDGYRGFLLALGGFGLVALIGTFDYVDRVNLCHSLLIPIALGAGSAVFRKVFCCRWRALSAK